MIDQAKRCKSWSIQIKKRGNQNPGMETKEKKVPTHKHWRLEIFIDRQTITMYYK